MTVPELPPRDATVRRYPLGMGGMVTRVLEAGEGDSVITFIHGVGARCDRWAGNIAAMASAGHRAFAFDLPGHGFATKGDGFPYGIRAYADLVHTFLDTMGIRRTFLVGTSMGGHIAARVACDDPERVSGLILVGTLGVVPMGPAHHDKCSGLRSFMRRYRSTPSSNRFFFVGSGSIASAFANNSGHALISLLYCRYIVLSAATRNRFRFSVSETLGTARTIVG